MALVSVQPREGLPLQQFSELIFDVELRGDYFDFYTWLQDVGEELGFVVVKRFEMSTFEVPDDGSDPRLVVQLTMASYRNRPA